MAENVKTKLLPVPPVSPPRATPALLRSPLTVAGLVLIVVFSLSALLASVLAPANPLDQKLSQRLKPPSPAHWLGTDQLGRDVLSRLLFGARISLTVGLVVVGTAGTFGTLVGLVAGYTGGLVDEALMRVTDVFLAFPALILAMAIAGALGPSLNNAMIAIAVVTWPVYARLVRGQVLSLREREFVEAARSLGASTARILWRHILPNTLAPILVQASFDMGGAILSAAGLSFIGFGAQPPTPEWGVMISDGRKYVSTQSWLSLFPGLAILLTVAAFNLIGDGLRDSLDPRLRGIM
ncbi:MAG: putative ABC transporter permease protein [Anaerolineales bacterium]|jgi:peptide/nickel transport system permease protein|nr:putative ABC transporter permease protein [Anaerolineales bacterium]MBM2849010.1 putative transporter permease protein [Anaerolineales bacterium]